MHVSHFSSRYICLIQVKACRWTILSLEHEETMLSSEHEENGVSDDSGGSSDPPFMLPGWPCVSSVGTWGSLCSTTCDAWVLCWGFSKDGRLSLATTFCRKATSPSSSWWRMKGRWRWWSTSFSVRNVSLKHVLCAALMTMNCLLFDHH